PTATRAAATTATRAAAAATPTAAGGGGEGGRPVVAGVHDELRDHPDLVGARGVGHRHGLRGARAGRGAPDQRLPGGVDVEVEDGEAAPAAKNVPAVRATTATETSGLSPFTSYVPYPAASHR